VVLRRLRHARAILQSEDLHLSANLVPTLAKSPAATCSWNQRVRSTSPVWNALYVKPATLHAERSIMSM
jgi:hypothetical protein